MMIADQKTTGFSRCGSPRHALARAGSGGGKAQVEEVTRLMAPRDSDLPRLNPHRDGGAVQTGTGKWCDKWVSGRHLFPLKAHQPPPLA